MDIKDILALCNAGFTAEQIGRMMSAATPAAPATDANTTQSGPKPRPQLQIPQHPEATATVAEPAADKYTELLAAVNGLKDTLIKSNIVNASQPPARVDTVDSIINTMMGGK